MELKFNKFADITSADDLSLGKSLTDLILEARKAALKEDIRANSVMISKRLAKVKGFVQIFSNSYADFPPLICGLEAFLTDELPDEYAFGIVEAPMTKREAVFEDGRKTGYNQGYKECAREIFEEIEKIIEDSEYELLDDLGDAIAKCHNAQMIIDELAELKKKYTEEGK